MATLKIIKDKPLIEDIFDYDIIIVGTGIHNALGNGFQYDVKINFPIVEETVKKTPYADKRKLGTVTVINSNPVFCLGFIHKGGYRKDLIPDYLDYQALTDVLTLIDKNFENKRIATSFIGCSQFDGNGNKDKVLDIFSGLSSDNEYFIYDYEQRDYREVHNEKWNEIQSLVGKIPYEDLRKLKDDFIKIRKHGIWGAEKQ
jgi:hypothetical protein